MNPETWAETWLSMNGTPMYQCVWVEAGKELKSNIGSHWRVSLSMRARLSQGFPAWIIEVPLTDDDVPF